MDHTESRFMGQGRVFFFILMIWAGIYLPRLGYLEFKGEEAHRVLPAVTMLSGGENADFMMPFIAGEPYFNKPPVINWLAAASYAITGVQNELTSRLVSAVCVLGVGAMMVFMPSGFLNIRGKISSAVIFFTAVSLIEKGRMIEIESVYVCQTAGAVLWWCNMYSLGRSRWLNYPVLGVILGAGMLTKGPAILLFFYAVMIFVLVYAGRKREIFSFAHITCLVIMLAMNYGWAAAGPWRYSGDQMSDVLVGDMLLRLVPKDFGFWAGNIAESLVAFLPWTLFLPILWDKRLTTKIEPENSALFRGLRAGFVTGYLAIMLMPRTETRYVLPVFSVSSIAIGWLLGKHEQMFESDKAWKKILQILFFLAVLSSIGGAVYIAVSGFTGSGQMFYSLLAIITASAAGLWALRGRNLPDEPVRLTMATGVLIAVFMVQYSAYAVPLIKVKNEKFRPAAEAVAEIVPADETIYIYRSEYESWLFYIREPKKHLHRPEQIDENVKYMIVEKIRRLELEEMPFYLARNPQTLYSFEKRIKGAYRLIRLDGDYNRSEAE